MGPRRALFLLPLVLILAFGALALWGLRPGRDPGAVPGGMAGESLPAFELAPLPGVRGEGVNRAALTGHDGPVLLNVFASWCAPCKVEHPVLMALAEARDVPIYGIAYKNDPAKARGWLKRRGNPYRAVGLLPEERGTVAVELGIAGVPETYVIAPDGTVLAKHSGALTRRALDDTVLPHLDVAGLE
jgi:cytochrome c biogenesis protein CcmG/thiol:disulfide interchange protein DsbE